MRPCWYVSRKLMQRSRVVLPEPLGPITQTTSPVAISRSTPRRTCRSPKNLCTPAILTIARSVSLDRPAVVEVMDIPRSPRHAVAVSPADPDTGAGNRKADDEVDDRRRRIERDHLAGALGDLARREHQVAHADERDQRRSLDELGGGVRPGRQDYRHRLGQEYVAQAGPEGEPDCLGRVGLSGRDGSQRAAHDLADVGCRKQGEGQRGGLEAADVGVDRVAEDRDMERGQAVEDQKDQHQKRDAADDVYVKPKY